MLNAGSNLLMLVVHIIGTLWLTRYLVSQLGLSSYGLIALAISLSVQMSYITDSMHRTIGRYLTVEISRGESAAANLTFNTALRGVVVLMLAVLPVIGGVTIFAPQVFDVAPGMENAARWMFAAVMLSYLVNTLRGMFELSTFVHGRFELQNAVRAVYLLGRILLIFAIFALLGPGLPAVGAATLAAMLVSTLLSWWFWRRLTPELTLAPQLFDWDRLRQIVSTGFWILVNQIGTALFLNFEIVVVSLMLDSASAGRYSLMLQWPHLLRSLSGSFVGVLAPLIIVRHAQNDAAGVMAMTRQTVRLVALASALPVGLICGLAPTLLLVWLGPGYEDMAPVLQVQVIHLTAALGMQTIFNTQAAMNRVRWPAIFTVGTGIVNVMLAFAWADKLPNGMGVALAGALLLLIRNMVLIATYHARLHALPWYTIQLDLLPGIVLTLLTALVSWGIHLLWPGTSLLYLIVVGGLIGAIYALIVYQRVLRPDERQLIRDVLQLR